MPDIERRQDAPRVMKEMGDRHCGQHDRLMLVLDRMETKIDSHGDVLHKLELDLSVSQQDRQRLHDEVSRVDAGMADAQTSVRLLTLESEQVRALSVKVGDMLASNSKAFSDLSDRLEKLGDSNDRKHAETIRRIEELETLVDQGRGMAKALHWGWIMAVAVAGVAGALMDHLLR